MLNKAIIVGRLTKDPELKSTQNGVSVLNFTVAVPRRFKDSSGERQSDFISCVAFRQTAEFISTWFKKGNIIAIDGSIQTRSYEQDGRRVYVTEVLVDGAGFVESKKEDSAQEELPDLPEEILSEDTPF